VLALRRTLQRLGIGETNAGEEIAWPGLGLARRDDPAIADSLDLDLAFFRMQFARQAEGHGVAGFEDLGDHVDTVYTTRRQSQRSDGAMERWSGGVVEWWSGGVVE
jgi:hypothetical protein